MKHLVFVHGRAQEGKDSIGLKADWITAWKRGLAKSNLELPIPETQIHFPYYGDTLAQLVAGRSVADAAEIVVRGTESDAAERAFILSYLREVQAKFGLADDKVATPADVVERGPLNWGWVHDILKGIDRYVPGGSSESIALFTHDVYQYLTDSSVREVIEEGVAKAMPADGAETVVVSHSLGTIVAYNLLRLQGKLRGWKVPLLVTVGSPLAVEAIRKTVRSFAPLRCPECAGGWYNALDPRDVVALYPLTPANFPLASAPAIENKTDVQNHTDNRHGIDGYLDDAEVAKRIYDAVI